MCLSKMLNTSFYLDSRPLFMLNFFHHFDLANFSISRLNPTSWGPSLFKKKLHHMIQYVVLFFSYVNILKIIKIIIIIMPPPCLSHIKKLWSILWPANLLYLVLIFHTSKQCPTLIISAFKVWHSGASLRLNFKPKVAPPFPPPPHPIITFLKQNHFYFSSFSPVTPFHCNFSE